MVTDVSWWKSGYYDDKCAKDWTYGHSSIDRYRMFPNSTGKYRGVIVSIKKEKNAIE